MTRRLWAPLSLTVLAAVCAGAPVTGPAMTCPRLAALTLPCPEPAGAELSAPAPPPESFPLLRGETASSFSLGDTSDGRLAHALALAESDALGILPRQKARDLRYGTRELVGAIEHAATALHAATETKLWVGNLSQRRGGDIRWSVSHNSGRDADIAFCYRDAAGKPIDPPDLVPLSSEGRSQDLKYYFDAERTWIVVAALLSYPDTQVQFLFMENGLKRQLLEAARAAGADAKLIERAATVVRQPGMAAPHNDHLHLRVYCSPRDVGGGCVNSGTVHDWVDLFPGARLAKIGEARRLLDDGDPEQRGHAVERLALLHATEQRAAIAERLRDDAGPVRGAAALALADLRATELAPKLVSGYAEERDEDVRIALLQAASRLGGKEAGELIAAAVGLPQRHPERVAELLEEALTLPQPALVGFSLLPDDDDRRLQLAAIAAAATSERLEPVSALIDLLEDRDGLVRESAAHALRLTTNMTYWVDWRDGNDETLASGRQRWRAAWDKSDKAPRDAWLVTGFRGAGYKVRALDRDATWELVRAIEGLDHVSYNAQRVLMRIYGHEPPSLRWEKDAACVHWYRWLNARRSSFKLDKPPKRLPGACYDGAP